MLVCANCGCADERLLACNKCHAAYYCTKECMAKHRSQHKKWCFVRKEPSQWSKMLATVWSNMKYADMNFLFVTFSETTIDWCRLNTNKTFADLERELRQRNFNTYIYAGSPDDIPPGTTIVSPVTFIENNSCLFSSVTCCKPKDEARAIAFANISSVAQNLVNLEHTGVLMTSDRLK